jgi:hypothetical protein
MLHVKQLAKQQSQRLNPQELLLLPHELPQQLMKPRKLHVMLSRLQLQLQRLEFQLSQ